MSGRVHIAAARWAALLSCLLLGLLAIVNAQAPPFDIQAEGIVVSIDPDGHRLEVRLNGSRGATRVPISSDVRVLAADGQALAGGLRADVLHPGAEVTVSASRANGPLTVVMLQLGHQLPKGRMTSGATVGLTPLTEMSATDRYGEEDGGLYGGGMNTPPPAHLAAAQADTAGVVPRDASGAPAADGLIGLISISMSNATMEYSAFKTIADADPRKSSRVAIVDGAQGGQAMAQWVARDARPWSVAEERLAEAGVSAAQVQVAWVKIANMRPVGDLETHGRKLYDDTLAVIRNAKARFPNLRIVYLGSRIFAGHAVTPLNPEPYAYEGAFIARWLIRDQMAGNAALRHTGAGAPVPLLLWGPYLWGDGLTPRKADGLIWERADLANDGTHPSDSGRRKVADLLLNFFTNDELARTWFVAGT